MIKSKSGYKAVFSQPALRPDYDPGKRAIINRARKAVKEYGGHARITHDGKEIYVCWQSSRYRGVQGVYLSRKQRPLNADHCPECHAPLKQNIKPKKFHVAPKTSLGKPCQLCGQLGMKL